MVYIFKHGYSKIIHTSLYNSNCIIYTHVMALAGVWSYSVTADYWNIVTR